VTKQENNLFYTEVPDGTTLYSRFRKTIHKDVDRRYIHSHYEIDKDIPKRYSKHYHTDNLTTLEVGRKLKRKLLRQFPIQEGDTVVEVGAYQGFGSLKLSKLVGEHGSVISIEADPLNFELLQKNLEVNKIKNVIPLNLGVYSKPGFMKLYSRGKSQGQKNTGNTLNPKCFEPEKHITVQVETIDNILVYNCIKKVDYIILEINLGEYDAIVGMESTIMKNETMRIVSAGWYEDDGVLACKRIEDHLKPRGFKVYTGIKNRVYAIKGMI